MKEQYLDNLLKKIPIDEPADRYYESCVTTVDHLGKVVYDHFGLITGYTSSMRYFPKQKIACAFQMNTDNGISDYSTQLFEEMRRFIKNHLKAA